VFKRFIEWMFPVQLGAVRPKVVKMSEWKAARSYGIRD